MRIRFQSRHGNPSVSIPSFFEVDDLDLRKWSDGEERDVDDARMVNFRMSFSEAAEVRRVRAVDALLNCGPDFVDAKTGMNPDYVCARCGKETTADSFFDAFNNEIAYVDNDKRRLCVRDFLVDHRDYLRQHIAAGLSTDDLDVIQQAIREQDDPARRDAGKNPPPAAAKTEPHPAPAPPAPTPEKK